METLTKNIDNSDEKNTITTMNRHEITPENRASVLAALMEDDTDSENSNNIFITSELTPDDRASTFSKPPADPHRPIVVETLAKNINDSDVQNSITTVKRHEITPENRASVLAALMEDDTDSENLNNIFKTSELTPDDRASSFSKPLADPHRPIVVETLTKNINDSDVQNSITTVKRHEITPENRASVLATLMKGDTDSDTSDKISKSSELTSENKDDTDSKCSSKTFKLSDNEDHKLELSVSVRTLNYNCDSDTESLKSSEGSSLALQTVLDTQRSERFQCFNVSVETMADKESSASNSQPLGDPSTGGNIDICKKTTECCVSTLADLLEDDRYSESSTKSSDEDEEKQLKYSHSVSIVIFDDTESSDTELESPNRYETSITYPIEISYAESSLTSQSTSDSQQCQHISEDSCTSEALSTENEDKVVQENNESFMQQISTLDSILEEEEVSSKSVSGTTARSTTEEFHRSVRTLNYNCDSDTESLKSSEGSSLALQTVLDTQRSERFQCFNVSVETMADKESSASNSQPLGDPSTGGNIDICKKTTECCVSTLADLLEDDRYSESSTKSSDEDEEKQLKYSDSVSIVIFDDTESSDTELEPPNRYETSITYPIEISYAESSLTSQSTSDSQQCQHISEDSCTSEALSTENEDKVVQKNNESFMQQISTLDSILEEEEVSSKPVSGTTARSTTEEFHRSGNIQKSDGSSQIEQRKKEKADASVLCELSPRLALSAEKVKLQSCEEKLEDSILHDNPLAQSSMIQSDEMNRSLSAAKKQIDELKQLQQRNSEQYETCRERTRELEDQSILKMRTQLRATGNQLSTARAQFVKLKKQISETNDAKVDRNTFEQYENIVIKSQQKVLTLQAQKDASELKLASQLAKAERDLELAQKNQELAKQQLEEIIAQVEKLKEEHHKEVGDLHEQKGALETENEAYLKDIFTHCESIKKFKRQVASLQADSIIRSRIQSEGKSAEKIEKLKSDLMKSQEQFEVVKEQLQKVSLEKKELQSEKYKTESEEKSAKEIEKLKDDLKKSQEQFEVVQKELQKVSLEKKELQSDKAEADSIIRSRIQSEEKSAEEIEKLKRDLMKSQEQFEVVQKELLKVSLEKKELQSDKAEADSIIRSRIQSEEKLFKGIEKLKGDLNKSQEQFDVVNHQSLKVSLEKKNLEDDKGKAETFKSHGFKSEVEDMEKIKFDLKESEKQLKIVEKKLLKVFLEKEQLKDDKVKAETILRSRIHNEEKPAEEIEKLKDDLKKSQDQFEVVQKELQEVSLKKKELQRDKDEVDTIIRSKIQFAEKSAEEIADLKKSQDQFEELQKVSLEKKELQSYKAEADSIIRSSIQSEEKSAKEIEKLKRDLMKSQEQFEVVQKELLKVILEKMELQSDKDEADSIIRSRIQSEEKSAEEIEKLKRDLMKSQEQFEVVQKELLKVILEKKELQSDKDEADSIIRSRIQSEEKSAEEIEKLKRDLMKSQEQFEVVQKEFLKVILEKKELQSDKAEGDSIIRSIIQSEENSAEEIETLKADLRKSQEQFKGVKEQLQKVSLGNVKMSVQCEKGKTEVFGASSGAALPNELKQLSLTKITKQLPNLQKELIKTRKQLESMSEQLTDLSGENQKLRLIKIDDIRESTEAVNELLEKMNVTQKEFEKVRKELPQSNEEISRWFSIDADLQIELTKAKQQRNAMEKKLFEQRIENKKLKKQLRRFKVNERKTIEEQSRSRKNIDIWKKRAEFAREETQRTRDALLTQIHELHKDKDVLNGEKMAMEKKQKDLEERILQLNEKLKKKSQQLNDSQQSNVSLSEMMERLQLDQSVRDQNEVKAKEDRMVIQHSLQTMTAALQVANTKLKKSQCEIRCMEEKTTELNLEIGGLNLNISQAKVRETALKESLQKTNQKVCELKEKIKYARAQREECEHSKSLIKMLNTDLNKLQSSYDKQHFSINTMSTRMQQLQNDCQTLQDQNQELQQYVDSANEREKTLCKSLETINKEFELERANNIALKIELETNQITLEQTRNHSTKLLGDLQERYNALKLAANADEKENVEKIARLRDKLRKIDMSNDWKSHAKHLKNEIECQKQKLSQTQTVFSGCDPDNSC